LLSSPSKELHTYPGCLALWNPYHRPPYSKELDSFSKVRQSDMELPTITEQDLRTFHLKHFPATSLPQSFAPAEDRGQEEEEDDLGYYPDGTKRTLTDDQIAMFRHSEIQQLLRKIRSQGIASSREAGSVDNVETNVAEISGVHSGDQRNSHKWPVSKSHPEVGLRLKFQ